jgi:hypothetical protein
VITALSTPSLGITFRRVVVQPLISFRFQLPLSGSQKGPRSASSTPRPKPFNSLSRDHDVMMRPVIRYSVRVEDFQLPLSGSPGLELCVVAHPDHVLSTPSLGITRCLPVHLFSATTAFLSTPSLGITRPRHLLQLRRVVPDLSTPSLGITEVPKREAVEVLGRGRAFNSLSRDHFCLVHVEVEHSALSTPSLGITGSLLVLYQSNAGNRLSTPSLGITEPDSGIFRLSAAFCRGAPSHK